MFNLGPGGSDMDFLDAAGRPGHDGTRDSMSIALAFSTSGAVYAASSVSSLPRR